MADETQIADFAKLRMIVGCLGESATDSWWHSGFFSAESQAFLAPVFPRTQWLARATAISEAAARFHDEHIGVGRVFHLFRLPEDMEQRIAEAIHEPAVTDSIAAIIGATAAATELLSKYAGSGTPAAQTGPIRIGRIDELAKARTFTTLAATYQKAFKSNARAFPFVSDRA